MTSPLIELQAERVILRQARPEDADAIRSYRSLVEVARFQSWTAFEPADARRLLDQQIGLEPDTPGTWFQLVIVDRTSDAVIGDLALHFLEEDHRQVEIGINLAPAHQGSGLAAEAVRCVLDILFGELNKHRVFAVTDAANDAAARLFRRIGFRQEGHFLDNVWFKERYGSEYLFALLARDWR